MMRLLSALTLLVILLAGCDQRTDLATPILVGSQPSREQLEQQIAKMERKERLEDRAVRRNAAASAGRERALLEYMGWLASAYPVCRQIPWLCGAQLAAQSRAAAAQGWPVRPGISLLVTVAVGLLWGLLGLVLARLAIWFLGPARRDAEAAEQLLAQVDARQADAEADLKTLEQRMAMLREAAQATATEVLARRNERDSLRTEVVRLQKCLAQESDELERVRRRRDAML